MVGVREMIAGRHGGHRLAARRATHVGALAISVVMVVTMLTGCDTTPVMLSGHVTASASGSNLGSVPVAVFANDVETQVAGTITDASGDFALQESALPAGTYRVRIGSQWWPSGTTWANTTPVVLSSAGLNRANVSLAEQATLAGTVVDKGAPAVGVVVVATSENGLVAGSTVTHANGEFNLGLLHPGSFTVALFEEGSADAVSVGGTSPTSFSPGVDDHLDLGTIDLATGLAPGHSAAVAGGTSHSCVVRANGSVACWGLNSSGQLGNGTNVSSTTPVEVSGITDATAIAAGGDDSCVLRANGTVVCWGDNWDGQLGNGTNTSSNVPVEVNGLVDAVAIGTADRHSCAVRATGTVVCWGSNQSGVLGNGIYTDSNIPVEVTGLVDATAISAGSSNSCAVRATGAVMCWGYNMQGQLGNGPGGLGSAVPVNVVGIADATAVSVGNSHSCALRSGGTVACWGDTIWGGLGDGTTTASSVPINVLGITDATAVTVGSTHSCALRATGAVDCWGGNQDGQLGNGTISNSGMPVGVNGLGDATAIGAGSSHSCAVRATGGVVCWGYNWEGQLGDGTKTATSVPVEVVGLDPVAVVPN